MFQHRIGRRLLRGIGIVAASLALAACAPPARKPVAVVVYKTASCQCCAHWVEHLRNAGFRVDVDDKTELTAVKKALGVPERLASCHTATVDGYVLEGHVPADDVRRLLAERPAAKGLAVPGMPIGSPGMEQGDRKDPYEVLLFTASGESRVFARHGP